MDATLCKVRNLNTRQIVAYQRAYKRYYSGIAPNNLSNVLDSLIWIKNVINPPSTMLNTVTPPMNRPSFIPSLLNTVFTPENANVKLSAMANVVPQRMPNNSVKLRMIERKIGRSCAENVPCSFGDSYGLMLTFQDSKLSHSSKTVLSIR